MTRKDELMLRVRNYVSLFVMGGAEVAATNSLVWMLRQVELDVLKRVDCYYSQHSPDEFVQWVTAQQEE